MPKPGIIALLGLVGMALLVLGCSAFDIRQPRMDSEPGPDYAQLKSRGYRELEAGYSHPLLREGVEIVTWMYRTSRPPHLLKVIRESGKTHQIGEASDIIPFLREIHSTEDALDYSELIRQFLSPGTEAHAGLGFILHADPNPAHRERAGRAGHYTASDAARWGVPLEPTVVAEDDTFRVARVVLLRPKRTSDGKLVEAWRVVLMGDFIGRDGTYLFRTIRVLQDEGASTYYWHPR